MAFECGHHSDCRIHSRPCFKAGEPAPNLARKPHSHVDTFIERNGEGRKEARKGVVLASPSVAVAQRGVRLCHSLRSGPVQCTSTYGEHGLSDILVEPSRAELEELICAAPP